MNSCVAMRVLQLDEGKRDGNSAPTRWYARSVSTAWTVRLEALVTILDVES